MIADIYNLYLGRQEDYFKFKATLIYIASSLSKKQWGGSTDMFSFRKTDLWVL